MAIKKSSKKKASTKKATTKKKASTKKSAKVKTKKSPVRKTTKSKKATKKTAKKVTKKKARKTTRKTARPHKPKLGFDPLSREDIEALSSPGVSGEPQSEHEHYTGVDALIRDTSVPPVVPTVPTAPELKVCAPEDMVSPTPEPETPAVPTAPEPKKPAPEPETPAPEPQVSPTSAPEAPTAPETKKPVPAVPEVPESPAIPTPGSAKPREVKKKQDEEDLAQVSTFFSFMLGEESFAMGIERVKEILEYQRPTSVPRMPRHMRGVINLRGSVVPVVDLRMLFGMSEAARTVHSAIIILEVGEGGELSTIGALVDSVREVLDIKDTAIEPAPRIGTGLNIDFLKGMGKVNIKGIEEFVMILDVDRVFSVKDLITK